MSEPWRALFVGATAAWAGALLLATAALALARRREGRDAAWALARRIAPLADLAGTWLGSAAVLALILGRRGFGPAWAAATLLLCLMLTACLYDRAVLVPSLDAAWRKLSHGEDRERWERDFAFLWRMAAWGRAATLAMALAALACAALA